MGLCYNTRCAVMHFLFSDMVGTVERSVTFNIIMLLLLCYVLLSFVAFSFVLTHFSIRCV